MVVKFPILGEIHLARLRAIGKESLWPGDGVARFGPYSKTVLNAGTFLLKEGRYDCTS